MLPEDKEKPVHEPLFIKGKIRKFSAHCSTCSKRIKKGVEAVFFLPNDRRGGITKVFCMKCVMNDEKVVKKLREMEGKEEQDASEEEA